MLDVGELADIELVHPYPVAEFVEVALADLRAQGHADAQFEPSAFLFRFNGDQRILVDRLYHELQNMPADARADHIRVRLDAELHRPPVNWPEAQPLLRSVLRPASFTAAVTADDNRPWIRPLWPFVHELAVIDTGSARAVVTQRDTADWGVGGEQMFAVARNNIAARYPPQPQQQRVGHLRGDGHSYCDSAALVPGWLSSFAAGSGSRPLVFFPGDEVLLVCTDDPEVAPGFFAAAERLYRQAVLPVSPQGYTTAGDTIVPLDRAGPTPVRSLAVRARSVLADGEYLAQTERLQRHFAEQALDARAGSVQLIETPRGSCTMTVWGEGSSWLLPETDYVTFMSADQTDYFTVPFPVVADVVGLVADPELVPTRYAAAGWPADDVMEVLRGHSVQLPGI
jgi:hypothetical protein